MSNFGIKDFYEVSFIPLEDIEMGGQIYSKDEPILRIEKPQLLTFGANDITRAARGGFDNLNLVEWSKIDEVQGVLQLGVTSKVSMAMAIGMELKKEIDSQLTIPMSERFFVGISQEVRLKYEPAGNIRVYVIEEDNRVREILDYEIEETTLILEEKGIDIEVVYDFLYEGEEEYIKIGSPNLQGYFRFVGKFYYTDEYTQEQRTGIIEIPRVKILTNFQLSLGRNTTPQISNLYFSANPIGDKYSKEFLRIRFLDKMV